MALSFPPKPLARCQEAHVSLQSPLGLIRISGCDIGIHEVKLQAASTPGQVCNEEAFQSQVQALPEPVPDPLNQCRAWLTAYFAKPQSASELPLPPFHHPVFERDSFTRQVLLALLGQVKVGDSINYKQLASLAGNERAARAVGGAMRSNPVPLLIPCHRVVHSNGHLGAYMGGHCNHAKEWLLAHEGVLQPQVGGIKGPAVLWA